MLRCYPDRSFSSSLVDAWLTFCCGRYPEQPWLLKKSAQGLLIGINLFQRFFMLPRGKDSWFFPIDIRLPKIDEKTSCPRLYPRKSVWLSFTD